MNGIAANAPRARCAVVAPVDISWAAGAALSVDAAWPHKGELIKKSAEALLTANARSP